MTDYSPAAVYALRRAPRGHVLGCACESCSICRDAFDAGADSRCICGTPGLDYDGPDEDCPIHGRPPVPAAVLLTADDPRIKVGAIVEVCYPDKDGQSVTYRHRVEAKGAAWGVEAVKDTTVHASVPVLLIEEAAEAPDPDADVVANLVCELVEIDDSREWTTVEARRILAVARADS